MKIVIPMGFSIYTAVQYAKEQAISTRHNYVSFIFNGIELCVSSNSLEEDICTIYQLESKIRRLERLT